MRGLAAAAPPTRGCRPRRVRGAPAPLVRDNAAEDVRLSRFALARRQLDRVLAAAPATPRAISTTATCIVCSHSARAAAGSVTPRSIWPAPATTRALALDPARAEAHRQLGLLYFQRAELRRAREELQAYLGGARRARRRARRRVRAGAGALMAPPPSAGRSRCRSTASRCPSTPTSPASSSGCGYTDAWSYEADGLDCFTALAPVALATRLRLGTAIANVFTRGPATLAMSAAGLADLAPGRFCLGLGAGSQPIVEAWNGGRFALPATRVREMVQVRARHPGRRARGLQRQGAERRRLPAGAAAGGAGADLRRRAAAGDAPGRGRGRPTA